ncbi:TonB-dependent receptor [Guyparkeria halophila]|uniref:TonB-dependent receptor n=1 Tax=Guyparkeria halophila TaxID=47960 RepID=A0ABZ0YWU6_9GAMM|nr:TonB-dependent receptor [Guyparkeria halophila]WQH16650.1 TonB-dependent receptor [Guyparkeria halophila]
MTHPDTRRPSSLTAKLAGLACLLTLAPLQANDRLGPINITAAREAPAIAPAMPETVITREEIERSQARSITDLLAGRAGLTVSNEGGPGKLSSVSIWGQSANRTAVFLDGVRIGSVSAGQSYLEHIPLEQIERIEIVRGPRSGQWGADAGGGVIQIFTREGTEDGSHLSGGIGAGSRSQREADAHIGARQGAFDYSLGVAHRETDGFDACENGGPYTPPCYADEPDNDGYQRDSLQLQAGYRFGEGGHVRVHVLAASAEVEYDGPTNNSEIEQRTIGLSASTGRIGFWQLRTRAGRHIDDQDYFRDRHFDSRFDTQRDTLSLANDFFLGPSTTLTLGADQTDDKLSSTTDYVEDARRNRGLFAQINTRLGERLDVQAALRRDFNEQFGTANTGSLDLAYRLDDAWTLTAGHGTSFNVPSFNLLYYPPYCIVPGLCFATANPDLEPERTRTSRAGVTWTRGPWAIEATAFRSSADDLISSPPPSYVPENVSEATIRGAELAAGWTTDKWSARTSLTYLSTESEATGEPLPKQPRWSGRLTVDRQLGAFSLGTTLRGRSGSENDNQGYVVADLRGSYRVAPDWRIEARVDNVFDRDYEVVDGFYQAPRGVFVSLRYGR